MCEVSESPNRPVVADTLVRDVLAACRRERLVPADADIATIWTTRLEHGYPTPFVGRDAVPTRWMAGCGPSGFSVAAALAPGVRSVEPGSRLDAGCRGGGCTAGRVGRTHIAPSGHRQRQAPGRPCGRRVNPHQALVTTQAWSRLGSALAYVPLIAAACFVCLYVALAVMRFGHPFELEWMEGGSVGQVSWILRTQAVRAAVARIHTVGLSPALLLSGGGRVVSPGRRLLPTPASVVHVFSGQHRADIRDGAARDPKRRGRAGSRVVCCLLPDGRRMVRSLAAATRCSLSCSGRSICSGRAGHPAPPRGRHLAGAFVLQQAGSARRGPAAGRLLALVNWRHGVWFVATAAVLMVGAPRSWTIGRTDGSVTTYSTSRWFGPGDTRASRVLLDARCGDASGRGLHSGAVSRDQDRHGPFARQVVLRCDGPGLVCRRMDSENPVWGYQNTLIPGLCGGQYPFRAWPRWSVAHPGTGGTLASKLWSACSNCSA